MKYVSEDLHLEPWQEGFVMVLLIVSAAFGALGAGWVADSAGLISAQVITASLGGVGSALSAGAFGPADLWIMYAGRLIAGLGMHTFAITSQLPWPVVRMGRVCNCIRIRTEHET